MIRHDAKCISPPVPNGTWILVTKVTDLRPVGWEPVPFAIAIEAQYSGPRTGGRWFVHCTSPEDQEARFKKICEAGPEECRKHHVSYAGFWLMKIGQS